MGALVAKVETMVCQSVPGLGVEGCSPSKGKGMFGSSDSLGKTSNNPQASESVMTTDMPCAPVPAGGGTVGRVCSDIPGNGPPRNIAGHKVMPSYVYQKNGEVETKRRSIAVPEEAVAKPPLPDY